MSKIKKEVIKLKGGYVPTKITDIDKTLQEINRGVGIHRPQKGKGSYKRKEKHRTKNFGF